MSLFADNINYLYYSMSTLPIFFLDRVSINENCVRDDQCTGTENAHCDKRATQNMSTCRCITGYVDKNLKCFKGIQTFYIIYQVKESCQV